jgi:hypothetical protein
MLGGIADRSEGLETMRAVDELNDVIRDVERIEHRLEECVDRMRSQQEVQRHLPGDEFMGRVFPSNPPSAGRVAPGFGA